MRRVPIGPTVVAAIEQHVKDFGTGLGPGVQHVLPVARSTAGDAWRAAVAGMDLPSRSGWRMLCPIHASLLITAGLLVTAVAERLGRADATELS